jgi:hypothetical protein
MATDKKTLSLQKYLELQKDEMLGSDNKYFAAEALGRSPTDEEAAKHYVEHGGSEHFAKKHHLKAGLTQPEN